MKHFNRKRVLGFIFIAFLAVLFLVHYQWQRFHYHEPMAAFYDLALAMEREDKTKLARLAPQATGAELYKLAKPYGGVPRLGKLLKESPEVSPVIHVPFASVDVFAKVKNKYFMVQFVRRQGRCVAAVAFFTG